jgi:hypothetical protein
MLFSIQALSKSRKSLGSNKKALLDPPKIDMLIKRREETFCRLDDPEAAPNGRVNNVLNWKTREIV